MKERLFSSKTLGQVVLLAGGLLFFGGCKKEEEVIIPGWYQKAAEYYFDLDSAGKTIQNFSIIAVRIVNPGIIELTERVQYPTRFGYSGLTNLSDLDLFTQKEGLFGEHPNSCGFISLSGSSRYLLVPANPRTEQQIPIYGCAKTLYGTDTIIATEEMITVPVGTYKTFSIAHYNGDRSWWSQGIGLVQYETDMKVDTGNKYIRVTLKLSQIKEL